MQASSPRRRLRWPDNYFRVFAGYRLEEVNYLDDLEEVMAIIFVLLVLIQFFNAYNCRSDRLSVLHRPFANRWLNTAVTWEVVLLIVIVYTPFLQRAFGTYSLTPTDWALTIALAFSIVPVIELVKWRARRGGFGTLA